MVATWCGLKGPHRLPRLPCAPAALAPVMPAALARLLFSRCFSQFVHAQNRLEHL